MNMPRAAASGAFHLPAWQSRAACVRGPALRPVPKAQRLVLSQTYGA